MIAVLLFACAGGGSEPKGASARTGDSGGGDSGGGEDTAAPDCPDDVVACVSTLPYRASADSTDGDRVLDGYSCAPDTDESGPELVWRVDVPSEGFLSAAVTDDAGAGIDIDVHLLRSRTAGDCLDRGNWDAGADVTAGTWWVVADTYVSDGEEQQGAFDLEIGFVVPSRGPCGMETGTIDRIGDGGDALAMPATGPMVLEAHLVTVEDGFGTAWPQSSREGLEGHYQDAVGQSGLVMHRDQDWAPQEGCEFGQSAYGDPLPIEDEGWYVNMYWSDRPDPGTRMILLGEDGRAVVAAAGYETGPGDLSHIAGTPEESHFFLGTGHLDDLTVGFASDSSLPLGPRYCE